MANLASRVPLKRRDHERVLVTETLPFETPLIFSGDGFYTRMKKVSASGKIHSDLIERLVSRESAKNHVTVPFSYKIRKGVSDFRKLAVLHPAGLWEVCKFYSTHDEWMIYQCGRSPFSIRAPFKLSGSFYEKSEADAINRFKQGQVITVDIESRSRYNPSYFAYRGFTRLYKFFRSDDFADLERRYDVLKSLDVSRCFDSIYTHSIAWALLGKPLAKENKNAATSADNFDELMRQVNHGETNGIVIGPEVSRIFAEIILQAVDLQTQRNLEEHDLHNGRQYSIRRYVDDVFIFADSSTTADEVHSVYANSMAAFNLYCNPGKTATVVRPFVTRKSVVINRAGVLVDDLSHCLFENYGVRSKHLLPSGGWRTGQVTNNFVTGIKTICHELDARYHDLSSYVISALCERIKRMVRRRTSLASDEVVRYVKVTNVLLRIIFFLYTVAPTVSASYRLVAGVTLLLRFARRNLGMECPAIEELIYSEGKNILASECLRKPASLSTFVPLEAINILLMLRELGDKYLVSEELIEKLFAPKGDAKGCSEWSYFDIASCIFYMRDHPSFAQLRIRVETEVDRRLSQIDDIDQNAERAYLFLDMLSCPYASNKRKKAWLIAFCTQFGISPYSPTQTQEFLSSIVHRPWFVNWHGVDILTLLQKKEVVRSY